MDALDRKLLNLLQKDSAVTAERLARAVPLSPSAITRRLKRLREDGTIWAEVAILSPKLRDRRVTAIVKVQVDRHTPQDLDTLKRMLTAAPEVQVCVEITGSNDLLLIVSTRDLSHFNEFADALAAQGIVRRYETSFVKKHIKISHTVELDEE